MLHLQTPESSRPTSLDYGRDSMSRPTSADYGPRAPPPSVQMGSDIGSDMGSELGSRPASLDYGRRAPPPSLAGNTGSRSDLASIGGRPSFEVPSGRPSFEIGGGTRPSFDIGSGRPSFDITGLRHLPGGQQPGSAPGSAPGSGAPSLQGHQIAFSRPGSDLGSEIGSAPITPGATPLPSRPASVDYGPRTPAQEAPASGPGSVQGHQIAFSDFGSEIGSNIGSAPTTPGASRPASVDYGSRRLPGVAEGTESVHGYALGSDLGSDMGSDIGSRPASLDYGTGAPKQVRAILPPLLLNLYFCSTEFTLATKLHGWGALRLIYLILLPLAARACSFWCCSCDPR